MNNPKLPFLSRRYFTSANGNEYELCQRISEEEWLTLTEEERKLFNDTRRVSPHPKTKKESLDNSSNSVKPKRNSASPFYDPTGLIKYLLP